MKEQNLILLALLSLLLTSCFTDNFKNQFSQQIKKVHCLTADQEIKKALSSIELHKLRFGQYPGTLNDLKFLGAFDSSIINSVVYQKLDSGYQLDLSESFLNLSPDSLKAYGLKYEPEFWKGLGCVKSNFKD